MTICNVSPFGHVDDNSLTWSSYVATMAAKKKEWPYERLKSIVPDLTVEKYNETWKILTSQMAYTTNLMPNATEKLRQSQSQQLIEDCYLFNKDWTMAAVSCKNTLHFHWDQSYQKCYTVRVPRNTTEVCLVHLFVPTGKFLIFIYI